MYILFARNPGHEYENTRHNVGEAYLKWLITKNYAKKVKSTNIYTRYEIRFNNYVGMGYVSNKYNINETYKLVEHIEDVRYIIIVDDLQCPIGLFKDNIPYTGKNFSHNLFKWWSRSSRPWKHGIVRVGVGNNPNNNFNTDVLGKFTKSELTLLDRVFTAITRELFNKDKNL